MAQYMKVSENVKRSAAMEEDHMQLISCKKRKFYMEENCDGVELVEEINALSPAASRTSVSSKRDDSGGGGVVKKWLRAVPDLESESFETEIYRSIDGCFSREATPIGEISGDSEETLMNASPPKKKLPKSSGTPRRNIPSSVAENMPTTAELEDFFAAAEEYNAKRFAEKYNYDIIKDVPLEGKYHWVRLQL